MTAGIGAADAAIYTGICVENVDPTGAGRIRYCVPQLSGTQSFGWANPVYPGVTAVGASVYVAFEGGDRNRPLFWPDQTVPEPLSYPTYAAMSAANPIASTPVGTEYYIIDHGGNVQLQNTGVPASPYGWQWLPCGMQAFVTSSAVKTATSNTTDTLLAQASFNNPSAKRIYEISANVGLYGSVSTMSVYIGFYTSTTPPPATFANSDGSNYPNVSYKILVQNGFAETTSFTAYVTGLALGVTYVGAYIGVGSTTSGLTVNTYKQYQLTVTDIGATT